jgi:hypothetical protein
MLTEKLVRDCYHLLLDREDVTESVLQTQMNNPSIEDLVIQMLCSDEFATRNRSVILSSPL